MPRLVLYSHFSKQTADILTSLPSLDIVEHRLSTPGRFTLVSHPKPLQKSKIELANLAGASSTTFPTPSTLRRLVLV